MFRKLVLAIPHSVRKFDSSQWSDPDSVERDADRWTDWFTDLMFAPKESPGIATVIGDISRFDCDLERLESDPLEAEGRGIIYTRSHSGATRNPSPELRKQLLQHWHSYRSQLRQAAEPGCLLIDCHSFPSAISPLDICIGFNEDWSRPNQETIDLVQAHFASEGLSVSINTPYSNSIAPNFGFPYQSLMIELNKRLYLCESTLTLLPRASEVQTYLACLYQQLLCS
jgi:N-formylglutamate amidohydrolase